MRHYIFLILAITVAMGAYAEKFNYRFNAQPLAAALSKISDEHPEIEVNFIYNELENYKTTASLDSSDPYEALRKLIGLNPVTIQRKGNVFFIEALQHGKFRYAGRAVGTDNEPVVAATVFLLSPKDSTVMTYGVTDASGRFVIPCDREGVIAKLTCLGYHTIFKRLDSFSAGTIIMPERAVALKEVKVEADDAFFYSDKSVFIPTTRQKNAAQTGGELINSMGIPQLRPNVGGSVQTLNGKNVAIYIDFVPATEGELIGMRMSDVKKVEYYDHPTDPRLEGHPHVVNFIMQHYEYGGYVKGYASPCIYDKGTYNGMLQGNAKLQYEKMTYDVAGSAFLSNVSHEGSESVESFRLPQEDGHVKEFERETTLADSHSKSRTYWGSFKARYDSEKIMMSNMVSVVVRRNPETVTSGAVTYLPADYLSGEYSSFASNRVNSISYNGYWRFLLQHSNTLTVSPYFSHSHTSQESIFEEMGIPAIKNGANDNSNIGRIDARLNHDFGKWGTMILNFQGLLYKTSTSYSGSSDVSDGTTTTRLGPGVTYSFKTDKLYGTAGAGLLWDRSSYGDVVEMSGVPWADLSFQYTFNKKNTVSTEFHFMKSVPSSSYRSESVIKSNPLMSYTGNPALRPYSSFDIGANYSFIPTKKYSASIFGNAWMVKDRYFFDYEASPKGILRTIKQPGGVYTDLHYGIFGSAKYLDGNLRLSATLRHDVVHNGAPYNWTKSSITYTLYAAYYVGNFHFTVNYTSPQEITDDCMDGAWIKSKDQFSLVAGWGNGSWNVQLYAKDIFRWNWEYGTTVMDSEFYSFKRTDINCNRHAYVDLSVTYTFGFGKKVNRGDEAYRQDGPGSGILK
ncbi:MAG: TonB-dependent receptor family protein [Muribaculaceae bacterium]|nr:TonB-dependent receptor family protein [Muribaculaceae bacterium]